MIIKFSIEQDKEKIWGDEKGEVGPNEKNRVADFEFEKFANG